MIKIEIPGRGDYEIENAVFDYNGTVAVNGEVNENTQKNLKKLSEYVNIYILTADTYGTVKKKCENLPVSVEVFPTHDAADYKEKIVKSLSGKSICFGNGYNDIKMFDIADLSVCIIEGEGCSGKLLSHSDIVVNSIDDAFGLVFNTDRIKATLRG